MATPTPRSSPAKPAAAKPKPPLRSGMLQNKRLDAPRNQAPKRKP